MSMISEQIRDIETVRDIIKYTDFQDENRNRTMVQILNDAIDTIKTQSEKLHAYAMEWSSQHYHDGWIPVDERLPNDDDNYLATMDDEDVQEVSYSQRWKKWSICEAEGIRWLNDSDVVAWRPLPTPYKREDKTL